MRFFVRRVSGIGTGAGMFVVIDGHTGREVSAWTYFESEANTTAARLNLNAEVEA